MTRTSLYAIFKNGSFLTLDSLQEAKKLPHYDFIVRKSGSTTSTNSSYEFIDLDGDFLNLQIGEIQLIRLKYEYDKWHYVLYNQRTKTYTKDTLNNKNFPWYNFFEKELFPQMGKLSESPEYISLYFNKQLDDINEKLKALSERIDNLQSDISSQSNNIS